MALITGLIPKQKFELVRELVVAIVAEELEQQRTLGADLPETVVYMERMVPVDTTEVPCVNVQLASGKYSDKSNRNVDGEYVYNIDVYTVGNSSDEERGDTAAMVLLSKYLGLIRAILDGPKYSTLGVAPGWIIHTSVRGLRIEDRNPEVNDVLSATVGRLQLMVRATEDFELSEGVALGLATTTAKIGLTNKGFKYIFNAAE